MVATIAQPETRPARPAPSRAAERWGIAAYLATVAVLVAAVLIRLGGTLVYTLDDAAIHMSLADTLIRHGTWGVTAGSFQSVSSSPLWTLLVAAGMAVAPIAEQWVPLVLNVVAGLATVVILGRNQAVLRPGRHRPLDAVAVVVLVVVVLFLPGLAVVGMEHTLHVALVLGVVILFQRRARDERDAAGLPRWLPYGLLVLATLTRFETAFVGAGLAAALLYDVGAPPAAVRRARLRQFAGVTLAVAVPIGLFALLNVALGGGVLPNSVLAKGQGVGPGNLRSGGLGPLAVLDRLARDPLLATMVAVAIGYVVLTWGRPARHRLTAVTLAVATLLHVTFADVGWFERYQAYLIGIGVYLLLGLLADLPDDLRRRGLVALMAVAVLFTPAKTALLLETPQYADQTYRHTYQAGRFLARYYGGEPIATDQLGYITLFHDGPVTDFAGLGDYQALRMSRAEGQVAVRRRLTEERGFRVAVVPDVSAGFNMPDGWVLAGQIRIDGPYTGVSRKLDFWATDPDEVTALQDHLRDFERRLPPRTTLVINGFAEMQAAAVRSKHPASGS